MSVFRSNPPRSSSFVGPSGSGKTTLLNLLGCLDKQTEGALTVAETDVASLDRKASAAFRGKTIGFILPFGKPVLAAGNGEKIPVSRFQKELGKTDPAARDLVKEQLAKMGVV